MRCCGIKSIAAALALLIFWGASKSFWEQHLATQASSLHNRVSSSLSWSLRAQIGQSAALAALGGFRGIAANFIWLKVQDAWAQKEWARLYTLVKLVTALQPRCSLFWDLGSWHLAWNASLARLSQPGSNPSRAQLEAQIWVGKGEELLSQGLEQNPDSVELLLQMGDLQWHRLHDYRQAAYYYQQAAARPGAPAYARRLPGFAYEQAGDYQAAYNYFLKLWKNSICHPANSPEQWEIIQRELIILEQKLKLPSSSFQIDSVSTP